VEDTWAARDLPVLAATVHLLEESYMVTVTDIAARTGLDEQAVARALEALDPVYVDFRKTTTGGDPTFWYVLKATPAARQAVGQWPTAETLMSRTLSARDCFRMRPGLSATRCGTRAYGRPRPCWARPGPRMPARTPIIRRPAAQADFPPLDPSAGALASRPVGGRCGAIGGQSECRRGPDQNAGTTSRSQAMAYAASS
jgi:hypothetical protein